jgi:hypothetical protein
MTEKQIIELKKSIFSDVSEYLQERLTNETESTSLNEGYWGTNPLANDYVLDIRDKLIHTNDDNFIKEIKRLSKGEPEDAWNAVGLCEFLIDAHIKLGIPFFLKGTRILDLYEKAIDNSDDTDWFKGWNDPEEIKASIENCRQNLKKYTKIIGES